MRKFNVEKLSSPKSMHTAAPSTDLFYSEHTSNKGEKYIFWVHNNNSSNSELKTDEKIEKIKAIFDTKSSVSFKRIKTIAQELVSSRGEKELIYSIVEKQKQTVLNRYAFQNKIHVLEFEFAIPNIYNIKQILSIYLSPFKNTREGEVLDSDYKFELVAELIAIDNNCNETDLATKFLQLDDSCTLSENDIKAMFNELLNDVFNHFELLIQP